ncbi:peptidase family C50-domain-containing protein [Scleroderma citrinum]
MCETWMAVAKRGGDMATLDYISELMTVSISPASFSITDQGHSARTTTPVSIDVEDLTTQVGQLSLQPEVSLQTRRMPEVRSSQNDTLVECAQFCAILVKATACLESDHSEVVKRVKQTVDNLPRYHSLISQLGSTCSDRKRLSPATSPGEDADVHRARGKMERALERLRRAAIRVLDAGKLDKIMKASVVSLLERIAEVLETDIKEVTRANQGPTDAFKDIVTTLLDSRLAIARLRLDPADVDTYTSSLHQLECAVATIDAIISVAHPSDSANFLRCISGAFHNLGGTLYKANRYGGATRFLKEGGDVGLRAVRLGAGQHSDQRVREKADVREEGESERNKEGWKQLEEQLFRRYELVGVCYSKIGDRKLAHEALLQSVRTFPYSQYPGIISPDPFVGDSGVLKQLASVVERLTYTATCELFLSPAEVSLRHVLDDSLSCLLGNVQSKTAITGTLLAYQLTVLESIVHKDGVREPMIYILQDLLAVYDAKSTPAQRAGAILTGLGILWRDEGATIDGGGLGSSRGDAEDMGKEALELLERDLPTVDNKIALLVPEYILRAHLYLALHAYRRLAGGPEMIGAVAMHIEKACEVLTSLLPGAEKIMGGSPNVKKVKRTVTTKAIKGKKGSAETTKSRGTRKGALNPVTPRPKKVVALDSPGTAPARGTGEIQTSCRKLNLASSAGLLQMNIHLLGLLGLIVLKVKLLEVLKRLCEQQIPVPIEAYSTFCVDLAHEYIKLGRPKRAGSIFNRCAAVFKAGTVPDEVRLRYLLGQAEVLALGDNITGSASVYCEAHDLEADVAIEDKTAPTAQRIRTRVERLERAALACRVFSAIQYSKDDMAGALCAMLQSLRLWNRATDALSRLNPLNNSASKTTQVNPFEAPNNVTPGSDQPTTPLSTRPPLTPVDALSWRLLSSLLSTLLSLAHSFFTRGSAREALYFAQQALDLAEATKASTVVARALTIRSEVLLGQGELKESKEALEKAAQLLENLPGVDAADVQRLRGDYRALSEVEAREDREESAQESYERAWKMLDELEGTLVTLDGGRRKSSIGTSLGTVVVNPGQGMTVPRLLSSIFRRHIWLLRNEGGDLFRQLVDRLMSLPPSAEIKGEEHAVMGKLTLHSVYEQFQADILLNSLTESTIALPMAMSRERDPSLSPTAQDILHALSNAEKLFWADLALTSRRGAVPHVREATVSLGMIQALQSALGKMISDGPLLAVLLLDASAAVTLHREMLEAVRYKFPDANSIDDLQWPILRDFASPSKPPDSASRPKSNPSTRRPIRVHPTSSLSSTTSSSELDAVPDAVDSYWSALWERHATATVSPSAFTTLSSDLAKLPQNWTVVHIILTPDKSAMLLSRLSSSSSPLLFSLPLRSQLDSDEPRLTLDEALAELCDIVRLSDEGARRAVHVRNDDPAERAAWWSERAVLDKRLKELLDNIEFCWLGGFKTILSPPPNLTPGHLNDLRTRVDKVLLRVLSSSDTKKRQPRSNVASTPYSVPLLSEPFLNCLASLPPSCRSEELEDLLCFMLDSYQLHDIPVAISEIDVDQAIVDLRSVLSEYRAVRKKTEKGNIAEDHHTFLVLDRRLQGIPWESIPVLRGRSVSRIPSLSFLLDRIHLTAWNKRTKTSNGHEIDEASQQMCPGDRIFIDPRKAYYVLNPSGDLKGTEGRFSSWLKQMHSVGWGGITGRAPSEQEFLNALSQKDLVIYFGHGGGEQYVRSHKIRHLPRCAATMLWGCSSGALKDMGEFDRVGTPYHYMLAGCPTLVANLWDVTDRDIDKFTQGVFDRLRLTPDDVSQGSSERGEMSGTSVVAAIAQSRQLCKLKYLTGAAPVVYGIPFYL